MKVSDLHEMASAQLKQGAGASFKQDYEVLLNFLGSNYETKT